MHAIYLICQRAGDKLLGQQMSLKHSLSCLISLLGLKSLTIHLIRPHFRFSNYYLSSFPGQHADAQFIYVTEERSSKVTFLNRKVTLPLRDWLRFIQITRASGESDRAETCTKSLKCSLINKHTWKQEGPAIFSRGKQVEDFTLDEF